MGAVQVDEIDANMYDDSLLLLREGIKPGWWDREANKISYVLSWTIVV